MKHLLALILALTQTQTFSPAVELDLQLLHAHRAAAAGDYPAAAQRYEKAASLGAPLPEDFYLDYALTLEALHRFSDAKLDLGLYLQRFGKQGKLYDQVLEHYAADEDKAASTPAPIPTPAAPPAPLPSPAAQPTAPPTPPPAPLIPTSAVKVPPPLPQLTLYPNGLPTLPVGATAKDAPDYFAAIRKLQSSQGYRDLLALTYKPLIVEKSSSSPSYATTVVTRIQPVGLGLYAQAEHIANSGPAAPADTIRTTYYAYGFFPIGSLTKPASQIDDPNQLGHTTAYLKEAFEITGSLFPLKVRESFKVRFVYVDAGVETHINLACAIDRTVGASTLDPRLTGTAWQLRCTRKVGKTITSYTTYFLEDLGVTLDTLTGTSPSLKDVNWYPTP